MPDVVERLRASREESDGEFYQSGFAVGKCWAEKMASAAELEYLEACRADCGADWQRLFDRGSNNAYAPYEWLAFTLDLETDGDRGAARDFWLNVGGDDERSHENPDFVRGFAEGALGLWYEVKDLI